MYKQSRRFDWSTAILVACALAMTTMAATKQLFPRRATTVQPAAPRNVKDWKPLLQGGRILGNTNAPLRIVEFSDFQCPYCRTMALTLKEVQRAHAESIAVHYYHLPLATHPHAEKAALASDCAGEQGRFQPYHDALFASQDSIGRTSWLEFAKASGVRDLEKFSRCVETSFFAPAVNSDRQQAEKLRLGATPSLIIEGRLYEGAMTFGQLDALVTDLLEAKRNGVVTAR